MNKMAKTVEHRLSSLEGQVRPLFMAVIAKKYAAATHFHGPSEESFELGARVSFDRNHAKQ
jgi:hypothetical protein